jgi:hypothetical protein
MKKIILLILISACGITSFAQYKKASFFQRGRKTIGFTAGVKLYKDGVTASPGICLTYGNDKGKNRIFHWWDLDYTAGSKFSYTTRDNYVPAATVNVNGKVKGSLFIAYNWGFYLRDNKKEENSFLPFIKLGVNALLAGQGILDFTISPSGSSPVKQPEYQSSGNIGGDIGAGCLYKFTDRIGLQANAGYRLMLANDAKETIFYTITDHPYINVGIRFLLKPKDD